MPGGQRLEFRRVAGEQNALALFFAEAVLHIALNAFAAVHTAAFTGKLALSRCSVVRPISNPQCQFSCTSTSGNPLIHDLQSLLARVERGQSPASSPQKAWIFFAATSSAAASARAFSLWSSSCLSCLISRWACCRRVLDPSALSR